MDADYENKLAILRQKIKSFPDFPKKGILFWDIFSALSDGTTCRMLQDLLVNVFKKNFPDADAVVGLESRGFLFSFSVAAELGIACLPVRKKGKLPGDVLSYKYELEYGSDIVEMQKSAVKQDLKCVIIDDIIATGGSMNAAIHLLKSCGANVIGVLAIMEIESLKGRENMPSDVPLHSMIKYD